MSRRYEVKGTKVYLYWSLGLLIVGMVYIWDGFLIQWLHGIYDGWLPRASVLTNHPDPSDHFYLFNQITGVAMLVGSAVCGYIHRVVK